MCCFHLSVSNPVGRWSIHKKEHVDKGLSYRPQICEILLSEASRKRNKILALFRGTCWMKPVRCLTALSE